MSVQDSIVPNPELVYLNAPLPTPTVLSWTLSSVV